MLWCLGTSQQWDWPRTTVKSVKLRGTVCSCMNDQGMIALNFWVLIYVWRIYFSFLLFCKLIYISAFCFFPRMLLSPMQIRWLYFSQKWLFQNFNHPTKSRNNICAVCKEWCIYSVLPFDRLLVSCQTSLHGTFNSLLTAGSPP